MHQSTFACFLLALAAAAGRGVGAATGAGVGRRATARVVVLASIVIRVVVAPIRVGICAKKKKEVQKRGYTCGKKNNDQQWSRKCKITADEYKIELFLQW